MAKTKFQIGDSIVPNSKAPVYARSRAKTLTCKITEQLGDGLYMAEWSDGEEFKIQGSHYDSVATVTKEQTVVNESTSDNAAATEESAEDQFTGLNEAVKEFITHNNSEIDKVRQSIAPQIATITERNTINVIAKEINRIPSPKVYKLMQELVYIQPELGNLTVKDLYLKAEGVLELSLK